MQVDPRVLRIQKYEFYRKTPMSVDEYLRHWVPKLYTSKIHIADKDGNRVIDIRKYKECSLMELKRVFYWKTDSTIETWFYSKNYPKDTASILGLQHLINIVTYKD